MQNAPAELLARGRFALTPAPNDVGRRITAFYGILRFQRNPTALAASKGTGKRPKRRSSHNCSQRTQRKPGRPGNHSHRNLGSLGILDMREPLGTWDPVVLFPCRRHRTFPS